MTDFSYTAYDAAGSRLNGTLDAANATDAQAQLRADGLTPIKITAQATQSSQPGLSFGRPKIRLADLEILTAELALLLENGVRIDRAFAVLARGELKPGVAELVDYVQQALRRGESFSQALREHGEQLDPLYINLVEVGEASGRLPAVLKGLAEDLRFRKDLRSKIVQALTYPMFVLGVCMLAIAAVFNFIVPRLSGLFAGVDELPVYTEILLGMSAFFRNYQLHLLAVIVAVVVGAVIAVRQPASKRALDGLLLRLPVAKNVIAQIERIRYGAALALTLESGLVLDKAMRLATSTVGNAPLRASLENAVEQVKRGEPLSRVLGQTPLLPGTFLSLVEVGEESGVLAPIFNEIAQRSRQAFEAWAVRLANLLEPLLIVLMGVIVGGVVVTMLLSIVAVQDIGF